MKIEKQVIDVLASAEVEGNKLRLTAQLDRALYQKVAKVLLSIGGKWNSKEKAHIFKEDVETMISNMLLTGEYTDAKQEFQFFPTPDALAKEIVERAGIDEGDVCLEPSAGHGNIAKYMPGCDVIELNPDNRKYLTENGFNLVHDDFMTFEPQKDYDVIVMNPPFCKQQDIKHVTKAIQIAKKCVVAIMSASPMWRTDKASEAFRYLVESYGGTLEELPEGAFKESGTNVKTCLVVVRK